MSEHDSDSGSGPGRKGFVRDVMRRIAPAGGRSLDDTEPDSPVEPGRERGAGEGERLIARLTLAGDASCRDENKILSVARRLIESSVRPIAERHISRTLTHAHPSLAGLFGRDDVHAEWPDIVSGRKPGRGSPDEVITYIALGIWGEYAAVLPAVYRRAIELGLGRRLAED